MKKGVGAFVVLEKGTEIPVVNAAFRKLPRFFVENIPVVEGLMEGRFIRVLRDSGCNTVLVKSQLVLA